MKYAIPLTGGKLCSHFGHSDQFAIYDVDENKKVIEKALLTPPPHEPGVYPAWLAQNGVKFVIGGGMGQRAQGLFQQNGIEVIVGASSDNPDEILEKHLDGTLKVGENICDH